MLRKEIMNYSARRAREDNATVNGSRRRLQKLLREINTWSTTPAHHPPSVAKDVHGICSLRAAAAAAKNQTSQTSCWNYYLSAHGHFYLSSYYYLDCSRYTSAQRSLVRTELHLTRPRHADDNKNMATDWHSIGGRRRQLLMIRKEPPSTTVLRIDRELYK